MNLSEIFIRRPVMTCLVMLSVLFFGILGYKSLPVSDLPDVAFPTIEVTTAYPGANPETHGQHGDLPTGEGNLPRLMAF